MVMEVVVVKVVLMMIPVQQQERLSFVLVLETCIGSLLSAGLIELWRHPAIKGENNPTYGDMKALSKTIKDLQRLSKYFRKPLKTVAKRFENHFKLQRFQLWSSHVCRATKLQ